jgi:hypothetical protein
MFGSTMKTTCMYEYGDFNWFFLFFSLYTKIDNHWIPVLVLRVAQHWSEHKAPQGFFPLCVPSAIQIKSILYFRMGKPDPLGLPSWSHIHLGACLENRGGPREHLPIHVKTSSRTFQASFRLRVRAGKNLGPNFEHFLTCCLAPSYL